MKNVVLIIAGLLCLPWGALGDDSKTVGNSTSGTAPIQAVAMPRVDNGSSPATSSPQTSQAPAPVITIVQPAAVPVSRPAPRNPRLAAILDAAQPKFDDLIDRAAQAKPSYGFEVDDNLNDAELGEPIAIYTVGEKDALAFSAGQKIDAVLKESGHWFVPVNMNGTVRTFIQVSETSSNVFEAVGTSVITARVWRTITARWPSEKNFHPKLVTYPAIPGYFFTVPEIQPQNMTDIVEILSEVDKPAVLSPAPVTLRSWR